MSRKRSRKKHPGPRVRTGPKIVDAGTIVLAATYCACSWDGCIEPGEGLPPGQAAAMGWSDEQYAQLLADGCGCLRPCQICGAGMTEEELDAWADTADPPRVL
jgi:hypothetical protein